MPSLTLPPTRVARHFSPSLPLQGTYLPSQQTAVSGCHDMLSLLPEYTPMSAPAPNTCTATSTLTITPLTSMLVEAAGVSSRLPSCVCGVMHPAV